MLHAPSSSPWPGLCGICRAWDRGGLCGDCRTRFAPARHRCGVCALALDADQPVCGRCLREPPPYAAAMAAVDYGPPWTSLIARFKFHDGLELAPAFAALLQQALDREAAAPPELLLPAPLSRERLRERGYNQSWELARRLSRAAGTRLDAGLLLKIRDTPHQIELPEPRRAANVRGAFAVEPLRRREVEGRDIAIVDDVLTTGATAAEMTRALRDAGAARVRLWVFARTPEPGAD